MGSLSLGILVIVLCVGLIFRKRGREIYFRYGHGGCLVRILVIFFPLVTTLFNVVHFVYFLILSGKWFLIKTI